MNKEVQYILKRLHQFGYEAYLVGGCVRDKIMNRDVHDYDICTSALPNEVESVFANHRIIETGLQHGTVTVVLADDSYEITTFRTDGDYSDGRHPDSVCFVRNLRDDLLRRDFTMNAIAFDGNEYFDLFGGMQDIEQHTIRCVGDADARFNEDSLRILRAMRFAAQFGFDIEDGTKQAMHNNCHLIRRVSCERIASELQKMLLGKHIYSVLHEFRDILAIIIPEFEATFDFDQKNDWHEYDVYEHIIHSVENIDAVKHLRLAMLFHDIGKPHSFVVDEAGVGHFYGHNDVSKDMCIDIMQRLRFDNDTIERVSVLVEHHDRTIDTSTRSVKRLVSKIGYDAARDLLKVKCADNLAQNYTKVQEHNLFDALCIVGAIIDDVESAQSCIDKKQLAIDGNDLKELGFPPSPLYSEIFDDLLEKVINEDLSNDRDELLRYVRVVYVFKIVATVDFGEGQKETIALHGHHLDYMEDKILKNIATLCKTKKIQHSQNIFIHMKFSELDFELDECENVYRYDAQEHILVLAKDW